VDIHNPIVQRSGATQFQGFFILVALNEGSAAQVVDIYRKNWQGCLGDFYYFHLSQPDYRAWVCLI